MDRCSSAIAVDILSDDEDGVAYSPSLARPKKRPAPDGDFTASAAGPPPTLLIIDDDPTPQKSNPIRTPSFVPETPLSSGPAFASDASMVRCSLARSDQGTRSPPLVQKFAGVSGIICLDTDSELEASPLERSSKNLGIMTGMCPSSRTETPVGTSSEKNLVELGAPTKQAIKSSNDKNGGVFSDNNTKYRSFDVWSGTASPMQIVCSPPHSDFYYGDAVSKMRSFDDEEHSILRQADSPTKLKDCPPKRKDKTVRVDAGNSKCKDGEPARKVQLKEEKNRLKEERKRKRQEEKLQKEALKAEAAAIKKLEKEKQKWEKGKLAIKSIVAEVDAKVVEIGSVGGHLLARLAEKGLSFRITSNPVERSILWKMNLPDQIAQVSSVGAEVQYILLVFQAEEFCNLVNSGSLIDHVYRVQGQYPLFTICYLTNKLMSYINKCEQNHYKNPSNASHWKRPPVEEVLSKLTTHFTKVHSRQCIDEAELAEHIVGLTSSLANCQFRKKLTWLSVNANGSMVPKDFIDRKLIKGSVWLKALVAIPKVQPRYAIAISKKYPTMRSLLNVYMDPNKSVHEKEFLLKDLMIEGLLGKEERRLGEVCSRRVYRVLMAQSGGIKTDDVEEGADFFGC